MLSALTYSCLCMYAVPEVDGFLCAPVIFSVVENILSRAWEPVNLLGRQIRERRCVSSRVFETRLLGIHVLLLCAHVLYPHIPLGVLVCFMSESFLDGVHVCLFGSHIWFSLWLCMFVRRRMYVCVVDRIFAWMYKLVCVCVCVCVCIICMYTLTCACVYTVVYFCVV